MADQKILTGNPVPSADPRDRYDNSIGLDEAVMSTGNAWTDRLGQQRRTLYWMERAATGIPAISAADRAEVAAAAAQLSAGIYDTIAAGIAATTNGKYFSVPNPPSADALLLYKNNAGAALFITSYSTGAASSLTMNIGKLFPSRRMVRNGVDSAENTLWSHFVVDMAVVGAEEGYFYRLGYFVNSAAGLPGADPNGWVIERIAEKDYATAANAAVRVVDYTAVGPTIGASGLQTITLASPIVKNLRFVITVDPSKRPALGTPINSLATANAGYSHIIDPSVYIPLSLTSTLNLNAGQDAPFKRVTRGGATLDANSLMRDAITSIRVMNAKPGKYYGLRYFQNGNAAVVPAADNWIIEEVPVSGYADSVITTPNSIATLQDNQQPLIDRTLGLQTITLQTKTDVKLLVTIDPSKLPAYGTQVPMNNTVYQGYSHIIDPACYELSGSLVGGVNYSIDKDKKARINWDDGTGMQRGFEYGKVGANNLANFSAIRLGNSILSGWTTDWLPPVVIDAAANGDVGASLNFTGGNHEVNSKKTAIMVSQEIFADGVPIKEGSAGVCDQLVIRQVNRLMAGNTVEAARYAAEQIFTVTFAAGAVSVECELVALEELHLYIDYGPQMVTGGAGGTLYYMDGQHATPIAFNSDASSGLPSAYPKAWASCYVYGDGSGQLSAWIDRTYGIADAKNSSDQYGLIIGGGTTSTKQYPTALHRFLARSTTAIPNHLVLPVGQSYKWRGGYSWQPVRLRSGVVASMDYLHMGSMRRADGYQSYGSVGSPREYGAKPLDSAEVTQAVSGLKPGQVSFVGRKSANLFDKGSAINGARINSVNGMVLGDYPTGVASEWIEVQPNTTYTQTEGNTFAEYTANKTFVKGYTTGTTQFTTAANTRFVRVTVRSVIIDSYMLVLGSDLPVKYQPYDWRTLESGIIPVDGKNARWAGKKWNVMGDSITADAASYWRAIATNLRFLDARNYGIGGTSIAYRDAPEGVPNPELYTEQWMGKRFVDMPTDADLITIAGGTNDFLQVPLGSYAVRDNATVYGAMRTMCEGVAARWPKATIAAILPFHRYNSQSAFNPYTFMQLRNAMLEVYAAYGIPVYDSALRSPIRFWNKDQADLWSRNSVATGLPDGLHPNDEAHAALVPSIQDWILSL